MSEIFERDSSSQPSLRRFDFLCMSRMRVRPACISGTLRSAASRARDAAERIERYVVVARASDQREAGARRLAFAIARVSAAVGLIEHAAWAEDQHDPGAPDATRFTERWVARDLASGLG